MAQYPFITISPDDKLIQYIDFDNSSNLLKVTHQIKLDPNEDVRWGDVDVIDKNKRSADFNNACALFDIVPKSSETIVVFYYDLFTVTRNYRIVRAFPEGGGYYPIPGKPKVIAAATLNPPPGGGVVSTTSSEAL